MKIKSLFSPEELVQINQALGDTDNTDSYEYPNLGRFHIEKALLPLSIEARLNKLVEPYSESPLKVMNPPLYVEYNAKYGEPRLNPHFDGDFTDLIIDYQLESNTTWHLGVDLETYALEDNEALIFNPNKNIHWRPRKTFQPGEYVKMLFFRFFNPVERSDYSHLPMHPSDPAFDEVNKLRDSLTPNEEI